MAPLLAAAGYRVLVPYLRGYGTTRFRSDATPRNGQQAVLAVDTVALMDALRIERATVAGYDWGARSADIMAALWPQRANALVSVSGYLIGSQAINAMPLAPQAELEWWYQFYFATERGRAGYEKYTRDFARLIWRLTEVELPPRRHVPFKVIELIPVPPVAVRQFLQLLNQVALALQGNVVLLAPQIIQVRLPVAQVLLVGFLLLPCQGELVGGVDTLQGLVQPLHGDHTFVVFAQDEIDAAAQPVQ